ncbi:FAD-binding oxidoreductase [Roseomonas sp. GC11]|uniref:NAD(P)/FAD-dependent oxidoreductase n=1 Tax=Roseomonas sp. GC11 TaxID=2950546 RepID=UPI00210AE37B|nr:FAD-binding oxidoreductase [Roseomonas sp. GC11]MCQ4159532.1 FAD-binding oxidoreductase [Roseomonas sp. GC11]
MTPEANRADVLIIGGGLMGAATAFFLRRHGLSAILIERDLVGQAATNASFGNIRRQGRFLPQLPLANRSRALWGQLGALLGEDAEFLASGHIRVAFEEAEAAKLEAYAAQARPYGLELEMIRGPAMRERFPFLSPAALMVSHSPQDGHANPRLAAPAFARAARRAGARVVERAPVLGITRDGVDFVVETRGAGSFRAPVVQVSAGAWGRAFARELGEDVPLTARSPQMGVTEPMPYRIPPVMGLASSRPGEGVYLRQVKRGNIVFGGGRRCPADLEGQRALLDPANTLRQLPFLAQLLPPMARLRVIRTWSGVEGYIGDDLPVMGASARLPGLFYAFGFCGHGFQLGPGVGASMADLIATGDAGVPLEPFSIARFAGGFPAAMAEGAHLE